MGRKTSHINRMSGPSWLETTSSSLKSLTAGEGEGLSRIGLGSMDEAGSIPSCVHLDDYSDFQIKVVVYWSGWHFEMALQDLR